MPFSHLYGKLADLRNLLYDRGFVRTFSLGARTVSIGNITTGGTGKTPLVAYVAKILAGRGEKVCILTRGYGRKNVRERVVVSDGTDLISDPEIAGDEPVELSISLGDKAVIIADPDRVAAAEFARREYGITAFILDDGFQHRRAARDVDIVCIDATNPWGGGRTLPGGRLREPVEDLSRADLIVITRTDLVSDISDLRSEISNLNARAKVFAASSEIERVYELGGSGTRQIRREQDIFDPGNRVRSIAFCAIGNPKSFFAQIENDVRSSFDLAGKLEFQDHHYYSQSDILEIETQARKLSAHALVTTAKDAVKLRDLSFTMPCYIVEVELVLDRPDEFALLL